MTIKEIRQLTGLTQKQFAEKYHITFSSIRNWESGHRTCPDYVAELLEMAVRKDTAQEVIHEKDHVGNIFRCPHCGYGFFDTMAWLKSYQYLCMDYKYCYNCGNKIQWLNVKKEMEGFKNGQ